MADPQSHSKMVHLLTPNPQEKHIDCSSSVAIAKYQKLLCPSCRLDSHLQQHRRLGPFLRWNHFLDFQGSVGVYRLSYVRTQYHCHTTTPCLYQSSLSSHPMWAISHLLGCVVTFLSDCSSRGGRGRPVTSAESRFSSVSGMRGS